MPSDFRYAGRDARGRLLKGTITAADTAEAASILRGRNLWVTDLRPASSLVVFSRRTGVSARDLGWFCRQLAALVQAGLAPGNAVALLGRQISNPKLRRALESVSALLGEGTGLADAFRAHPEVFSALFCSMAEAGELSGRLAPVMERLGAYYERQHSFRSRVVAALTYPTLILAVAAAVFVILLVYILPSFHGMLLTLNVPMPVSASIVFSVSLFLQDHLTLLMAAPVLCAVLGWRAFRGKARGSVDRLILRVPVIGRLYLSGMMSGMCRTLGGLSAGGVPILKALKVVEQMSGHSALAPVLRQARIRVAEGVPLAEVFRHERLIPGIIPEMLAVGEQTGELGSLLDRAADYYDQEAHTQITRITTILEPLLILGIGILVGLILLSVLLPMFDVVWSIQ